MRAHKSAAGSAGAGPSIHDRILGDLDGGEDEAIIFAAASIINEITGSRYTGEPVVRSVRTDERQYTLRGQRVRGPDGSHPVVVVVAEPVIGSRMTGPAKPPLKENRIHSRFRLTRKEELVAGLLAANRSNREIAAELCVSHHTARHHTQNVLTKLGVRSRKEVVSVLRED